jgi:hypothetical protein
MWSPNLVPYGADQTVYLVVDRFGASGGMCHETEVERTDLEAIVGDLISGRFNDPVRVVAFNTLEHWSKDVSADVAVEIQTRCDIEREPLPEHLRDFAERHARSTSKLAVQLA